MNVEFKELLGKTIERIESKEDVIKFYTKDYVYILCHTQNCCESVYVESIVGDLDDLIGNPILIAEEATSDENPSDVKKEIIKYQNSFTWTFYKLATIKGHVDIRWYGESNGYYSESVDFYREVIK